METPEDSFDGDEMVRAENAIDSDEERLREEMEKTARLYSREDIGLMLLADADARRRMEWSLLNSSEILQLSTQLIESPAEFGFRTDELLLIGAIKPRSMRSPFIPFRKQFLFVDAILLAFPDKLIVAGGSVFKAFLGKHKNVRRNLDDDLEDNRFVGGATDVDFFFIDCTKEEVETIICFTWALLHDPTWINRIIDQIEASGINEGGVPFSRVYFSSMDRCQNTTTIYYGEDANDQNPDAMAEYGWHEGGKMQFIHRSYPNKASVIGGFDIGVCMGFYDGIDFYATPFGAWSIATQTIILDVSRRSTSFEHRIAKYVRRYECQLVIVNGNNSELYAIQDQSEVQRMRTERITAPVRGLKIKSRHFVRSRFQAIKDADRDEDDECDSDDGEDGAGEIIITEEFRGVQWLSDQAQAMRDAVNAFVELGLDPSAVVPVSTPITVGGKRLHIEHRGYKQEATRRTIALMERNALRFKDKFDAMHDERNGMSDYDGGNFNAYNVAGANAVFASRGKIDCITWRSNSTKAIYAEDPVIRCEIHPVMVDDEETPEMMYLSTLKLWFPDEIVKKIIAGPVRPPQLVPIHREIFQSACALVRETVEKNIELAREKSRQGITLITENPGRQWTSSNNPVVSDVRNYYHPALLANRSPLTIGIPHPVFCQLYFAWQKQSCGGLKTWRLFGKDVFRLICQWVVRLMAEDGNRLLTGRV